MSYLEHEPDYLEYEAQETPLSGTDCDHVMTHLQGLVQEIYETGSLEELEFHLKEVVGVFGMELPSTAVVLQKKPTEQEHRTDRMLKHWVGYTRAYSEMMTTSRR